MIESQTHDSEFKKTQYYVEQLLNASNEKRTDIAMERLIKIFDLNKTTVNAEKD